MHHEALEQLLLARGVLASRPVKLQEAAEVACISPFHFHRLFSEAFGQTPHEFAREARMMRARQLLLESDLSVGEIGLEVGFSTPSTFATAFSKRYGFSPIEFRHQSRRFWSVSGWRTHRFVPTCFHPHLQIRKIEEVLTGSLQLVSSLI